MKKSVQLVTVVAVLSLALADTTLAGAGGAAEFGSVRTMVQDWVEGELGKFLALGAFAVGAGIGLARQNLMYIVQGIGASIAVYYTPGVIDNIIAATLFDFGTGGAAIGWTALAAVTLGGLAWGLRRLLDWTQTRIRALRLAGASLSAAG